MHLWVGCVRVDARLGRVRVRVRARVRARAKARVRAGAGVRVGVGVGVRVRIGVRVRVPARSALAFFSRSSAISERKMSTCLGLGLEESYSYSRILFVQ